MNDGPDARPAQAEYESALVWMRNAKWYAFDLDDTIHSFRKASAAAVRAVLEDIHAQSGHTAEKLEVEYRRILTQRTASAFIDGKTSHQYREDRFRQLVQDLDIQLEDGQLQVLVELYERVLIKSLELKPGVLALLKTLKTNGHKIAVITEGPQDAQERTIEALGLTPHIDHLATTNKYGVSKTGGLFNQVLEHLQIEPKEMVMTGDSWERDIVPAMQAGMYCFHYSEAMDQSEAYRGLLRIDRFAKLQVLVKAAHDLHRRPEIPGTCIVAGMVVALNCN